MPSLWAASIIGIIFFTVCLSLIPKLQRMQNSVARLVYTAPRFCHITPLLTKLHWLNIKHRIDFKIILIMYKAIHGVAPP